MSGVYGILGGYADKARLDAQIAEQRAAIGNTNAYKSAFTGDSINVAGGRGRTDVPIGEERYNGGKLIVGGNSATEAADALQVRTNQLLYENEDIINKQGAPAWMDAETGTMGWALPNQPEIIGVPNGSLLMGSSSQTSISNMSAWDGFVMDNPRIGGIANAGVNVGRGIVSVVNSDWLADDAFNYVMGNNRNVVTNKFYPQSDAGKAIQEGRFTQYLKDSVTSSLTATVRAPRDVAHGFYTGNSDEIGSGGAIILGTVGTGGLGRLGRVGGVEVAVDIQAKLPRVRLSAETQRLLRKSAEKDMVNAHDHHTLSVNGRPGPERVLVREGQDILRSYDIDPLHGIENLVRAPNKGHTMEATQRLVDELRGAKDLGYTRNEVVEILRKYGKEASKR